MSFSSFDVILFVLTIIPIYSSSRLVDNLPCATRVVTQESDSIQYEHGYRLGFLHNQNVAVNNHLKIILHYHSEDS